MSPHRLRRRALHLPGPRAKMPTYLCASPKLKGQSKHDARACCAAFRRRAVEAPVAPLDQPGIGGGAVATREAMECRQRPGRVDLEQRPVPRVATGARRAVEARVAPLDPP